jgi:replicative DNA helicase
MKECYGALLHKKKVDRVLRYSLAVQAGISVQESMAKRAVEDFNKNIADYELVLGDLLPPRWRAQLEEIRYALNENVTAAGDWGAFMRRLKRQRRVPQGLLTGCNPYDQATGGLRGVTLLAGLTGAGKTTLGLNFALGVLRQQKNTGVVVFNLETGNDNYFTKLLSLVTGVAYRTLRVHPWPSEVEDAVADAQERLASDILPRLRVVDRIEDTGEGRLTLDVMVKKIRAFKDETKVERILVIVDRLQKLEVENPIEKVFKDGTAKRGQLTDLEADDARMEMLLRLQKWSQSVDPPGFSVLALSRVNKTDPGRRLTLADVPGKAELVFQADSVLLLEPGSWATASAEVTPTFLNVAKVRDGGLKGDIRLDFHHTISLFKEPSQNTKGSSPMSKESARGGPLGKSKRFAGK